MRAFVYGTLRQGDCRGGVLEGYECISPDAKLYGYKMLHLGAFPGIVPGDPEDVVIGELYEVDEAAVRTMDGIEGYRKDDPKGSLYVRTPVEVEVEDNLFFEDVYTYVFNQAGRRTHARVIETGDWFNQGEDSESASGTGA